MPARRDAVPPAACDPAIRRAALRASPSQRETSSAAVAACTPTSSRHAAAVGPLRLIPVIMSAIYERNASIAIEFIVRGRATPITMAESDDTSRTYIVVLI